MNDDPYADRRRLTFEQAEGVEPLPGQLKTKELSQELRAVLWKVMYERLYSCEQDCVLVAPWDEILEDEGVFHRHRMIDEYSFLFTERKTSVKSLLERGDYLEVLGFIQYVLRHKLCPGDFPDEVERALRCGRGAYRVLDRTTIVPVASDHDAETIQRAFNDLEKEELQGARSHLRSAGSNLTDGDYAASIRESIHSVESVVRVLTSSRTLADALRVLEKQVRIPGGLRAGFSSIYGYTSNEAGLRHALLDDPQAQVDEADALFMIGACTAFVSYLINKARAAGLLNTRDLA